MCEFSIITPVYNVEEYLPQCIESVLNQDFNSFELILIDDGSTDSSGLIADSYQKKDSRIKVIHKENEGQGVARNIALKEAQGKYILYLDSDDWLEKDALTHLYNKFQEDDYDVIFFNVYEYFEKTRLKREYYYNNNFSIRFNENAFNINDAYDILFTTNGLSFKAYNRDFLIQNNIKYSDTKYIEDSEFFIKIILYAKKMVCLNKFLSNYRIRESSSRSTVHLNIEQIEQVYYICENIVLEYCNKNVNYKDIILKSFIENRVRQLLYHFSRCQTLKYKNIYFNMMKNIFKHIQKTYNDYIIEECHLGDDFNNVIKLNCITYIISNRFLAILCHLQCYSDIH